MRKGDKYSPRTSTCEDSLASTIAISGVRCDTVMLELLQGSDHVIQKDHEMFPAEERALRAMDVEEVGRICWNCYKAVIM